MSFLTLESVGKRYGAVAALAAVDLAVPEGSRTAIVGPSGSGKTTLLRLVAGFEAPDTGRIRLGHEILANGPDAIPAHRRGVGVVMQDGALFPHLSVIDNIGFGLDRATPHRAGLIADLMRMVELDPALRHRRPDALSGGQQQRVALARALARKPRLMLLDEPFSALDTGLRASTRKSVAALLAAAGITTILVTHDQAEALSFADQVAVMGAGRLLQVGPPQELYRRPATRMIAEFLGDVVILPASFADGHADTPLGRLPIADHRRTGTGEVMLRPEQITLSARQATAGDAPWGEITDIDFGGAVCTVTLRMSGKTEAALPELTLRRAGLETLPIGTRAQLTVTGEAHSFAAATNG